MNVAESNKSQHMTFFILKFFNGSSCLQEIFKYHVLVYQVLHDLAPAVFSQLIFHAVPPKPNSVSNYIQVPNCTMIFHDFVSLYVLLPFPIISMLLLSAKQNFIQPLWVLLWVSILQDKWIIPFCANILLMSCCYYESINIVNNCLYT